ncbi:MAG: sigma-54 dependent transcriptional regulator [Syntrophales bacterium]|nr:sigma-54 dependent transcriptional regulator [Syntrophales bacterium]
MFPVIPNILVVDDEEEIRKILAHIIEAEGFKALLAPDGHKAIQAVCVAKPDAVLLDVRMPGLNGMEVLKKIKDLNPDLPVVLVTAFADIHQAVEAMKIGAHDYLAKPFDNQDVVRVIHRALGEGELKKRLKAALHKLHGNDGSKSSLVELMGPSDRVVRLVTDVNRVARSNFAVVITGETGTGKELVARAIHQASPRAGEPFVPVDCGSIPENLLESELFGHEKGSFTGADAQKKGKFEMAQKGTLFMDEIANMPLGSQAKFLRVLQDKQLYRMGGKACRCRHPGHNGHPIRKSSRPEPFHIQIYNALNLPHRAGKTIKTIL